MMNISRFRVNLTMGNKSLPLIWLIAYCLLGCDAGDLRPVSFDGEWKVIEVTQGDSIWTGFDHNKISVSLRISDRSTKYELTALIHDPMSGEDSSSTDIYSVTAARAPGRFSAIDDSVVVNMSGRLEAFVQPPILAFYNLIEGAPFPAFWAQASPGVLDLHIRPRDLGRLSATWGISPREELHIKLIADVLN